MIALTARTDGVVIPVKAQPGARSNGVTGEHAGALRIAVSAPPEKGKANDAVLELLAEVLCCRPGQVELLTGATSRSKTFLVGGVSLDDVRGRLDRALGVAGIVSKPEH